MIRPAAPIERNFVRSSWLRSYASSEFALFCTPHDGAANVPDARKHTTKCLSCGAHALRSDERNGFTRWRVGRTYREGQTKLIDALLERCNVSVYAADDGGPEVHGWIVREDVRPVLHYVYVQWSAREGRRGASIARELVADLAEQPTRYTHKSRALRPSRLPAAWTFDPYALMGIA